MTRAKDEDGQAIVEFVLILPIFLLLIFIAVGYGITLNNYLRATDVAQVAARAASEARFHGIDPCDAANTAATGAANGLALSQPVGCDPNGGQPGNPIKVTVTVPTSNILTSIPLLSTLLPPAVSGSATVILQ